MNTKTKRILMLVAAIIIILLAFFYFTRNKQATPSNSSDQYSNQTPAKDDSMTKPEVTTAPIPETAVVVVDTNMGSFEVTLDGKAAPLTVANFIKLATDKYCDGTKFHRVLKDFVIQGCDPNSRNGDVSTWGQGGPGYTVPAEIGLKANVGAIGMASTQAKGPSSGSQFFIVTEESANSHAALDGNYTFFGYVTSGMNTVSKIAATPVQPNLFGEPSLPITPMIINSITIKK